MNEALAQTLSAFELVLRTSLPLLAVALVVTLVGALLALWTRLAEPAIGALSRALVTLLVLGGTGGYIASELVGYASGLFRALPELAR
jgi:flagellar biosynthesis protein FliQ